MKIFYQKKDLLEKAGTIKRFEYSALGSELKKQTNVAINQHQGLEKVYEFNKKSVDKTTTTTTKIMHKKVFCGFVHIY